MTATKDKGRIRSLQETGLQDSLDRLRTIIKNAPTLIYLKDVDGNYLLNNRRHESIFQAAPGELIGRTDWQILPREVADRLRENDLQVLAAGQPMEFEETLPQKDGPHTYISLKFPLLNQRRQPFAICGISTDITERKKLEAELLESKRNQNLSYFTAHLVSIREKERTRIAREIHDELGQSLTALRLDLSSLMESISKIKETAARNRATEQARAMSKLIDETIQAVRKISTDLRPGVLDDLGLEAAIEWQAKEFQRRTGILTHLYFSGEVQLTAEQSTTIFRIFQEILTNIVRHSKATRVYIRFKQERGGLHLEVQDNGKGISKAELADPRSLGILGMMERAALLGGDLEVLSPSGEGTTVTLQVPAEALWMNSSPMERNGSLEY